MACSLEYSERIADLPRGGLIDPAIAEGVLDHVAECPACSAEFDTVADLFGAMHRDPELFDGSKHTPMRRPLAMAVATAAATLLAVILWFSQARAASDFALLASLDALPADEPALRAGLHTGKPEGFTEAMKHYARNDFASASVLLRTVVNTPTDALTQLYLGICELRLGVYPRAITALEQAAEHGSGLVQERGLWFLADAHLLSQNGESAEAALEQLAELGGDYSLNAAEKLSAVRGALTR